MGQAQFSKPVFLKLHRDGNFQARSAADALQYLEDHWVAGRTAHYRRAKVLCRAAMDGIVDAETARTALVDAAGRNGVLADGRQVDGVHTSTTFVPGLAEWSDPRNDIDEVSEADFVGYFRAQDILDDPWLSPSRKRALLAFWASDANSVVGVTGLRSVRGATVTIDSLLDALCELDAEVDQAAMSEAASRFGRSW